MADVRAKQLIEQGRQDEKNGDKEMSTSLFKWKPRPEPASVAYTAAGRAFQNAKAWEDMRRVYIKAADAHEQTGALFHAGQAKCLAAKAAVEMGDKTGARALYCEAAVMYRLNNSVSQAEAALKSAIKALEKVGDDEGALEVALELCGILSEEDMDVRLAYDSYRMAVKLALRLGRYDTAMQLMDTQISHFTETEQSGQLFKTYLSYVVVALATNDYVAADRAQTKFLAVHGYLRSKEGMAGNELLDAFEAGDDDAVSAVTSQQVFKFLEQGIVRLAKRLTSGGVKSGGSKSKSGKKSASGKSKKRAPASAAAAADADTAGSSSARSALFAMPSGADAGADAGAADADAGAADADAGAADADAGAADADAGAADADAGAADADADEVAYEDDSEDSDDSLL